MDWSLLLLFTPMWTCVVLAGTLRCITPPHPQVRRKQGAHASFRRQETAVSHWLVTEGTNMPPR